MDNKELMDYLLSEEEIVELIRTTYYPDRKAINKAICEAQLQKVAPYIEAEVVEKRRLRQVLLALKPNLSYFFNKAGAKAHSQLGCAGGAISPLENA